MEGDPRPKRSTVRWEDPDTIFITLVGRIDGDAMRGINATATTCGTGKPFVFILIDLAHAESMTAEARSLAPGPAKVVRARAVALFGASYHIRVITGLISRVAALIGKQHDKPTRFFETEAEARAWLAERRAVVSSQAATRHPNQAGG